MKKHFFAAVRLPDTLAHGVSDHCGELAHDIQQPKLSLQERQQNLLDRKDLGDLDFGSAYQSAICYHPAPLPSGEIEIGRRLSSLLLRTEDDFLREFVGEQLGIDNIAGQVDELAGLEAHDRDGAYRHAMAGALGSATQAVPRDGYGDELDAGHLEPEQAKAILDELGKYWIANDLQMMATACRQQLRRPTGIELLDGAFTGHLARAGAAASAIEKELTLFERVARAHRRPTLGAQTATLALTITNPEGTGFAGRQAGPPMALSLRPNLPANDPLAMELRSSGLEAQALAAEALWRKNHGDRLEDYVDSIMDEARQMLGQLRHHASGVRKDPKLSNERLVNRHHDLHPLAQLYLACERAVAWCDALTFSRRPRLRLTIEQIGRARRLFFALRFAIVRDLDCLTVSLRDEAILLNGDVVRADGKPFGFEQLLEAAEKRRDIERFSVRFASRARKFARDNTGDEGVRHADGTIAWRLQQ